jgi:hypothetical protein
MNIEVKLLSKSQLFDTLITCGHGDSKERLGNAQIVDKDVEIRNIPSSVRMTVIESSNFKLPSKRRVRFGEPQTMKCVHA